MKLNSGFKILEICCKCGKKLLRYKKGPGRRLLKVHRDRITKDFTDGLFTKEYSQKDEKIYCPNCKKRLSTIKIIKGKYLHKLNQGQLGLIK